MSKSVRLVGRTSTVGGGRSGFMDGPVSQALFNHPVGVAVDSGGTIFVSDCWTHRIRRISVQGTLFLLGQHGFRQGTTCGTLVRCTSETSWAERRKYTFSLVF